MAYEKMNLFIGALAYIIGVVAANIFMPQFRPVFSFPLWLETIIICIGVMSMSVFFYSRFSYSLLFIAGIYFGNLLQLMPPFVILALLPLTFAHWAGIEMGVSARQDFFGKKNFFEDKEKFAFFILVLAVLAGIVGFLPDLAPSYFNFQIPININPAQ